MASSVSVSGSTLTYTGSSEANALTISPSGSDLAVHDSGVLIVGSGGCSTGLSDVTCPAAGVTLLSVDLGGNNDSATNSTAVNSSINGGAGTDTLTGGTAADIFPQGSSADGADTLNGGDGPDTVDYSGRSAAVTVSLDGVGNDGDPSAGGEHDNVGTDFENVKGGSGGDVITAQADATPNDLSGGGGADTLTGNDGADTLTGGLGHDIVNAGDGADNLQLSDGAADDADCGSDADADTGNVDDLDTLTNCSPPDTIGTADTQPPDTSIGSGPSGPTNDSTPSFGFSSTESSTFECSIDQGSASFSPCAGPGLSSAGTYTPVAPLADGSWTFRVRGTDSSGNTDQSPATRAFTLDTQAPETQIDSGPSGVVQDNDVQFAYSANESSSFECSLDGSAFSACPSSGRSYNDLADGDHTFAVRAIDAAANIDPTPATRQFSVDAAAPVTQIDSGPAGFSGPNVSFTYSASEPSTFECSLDGSDFEACPAAGQSYSGLQQGLHLFKVRARDATGNADGNPPVRAFFVDTSPPQSFITGGPKKRTRDHTPTFHFRTNEEGAVTLCSLDSGPFAFCQDSLTTPRLKRGRHRFEVTSVDLAGNLDPTPAVRGFRIR